MSILGQTGAKACKECGERARAERDRLEAENAKLRKFANTMRVTIKDACGVCDEVYCSSYDEEQECCMFDSVARSLGIEVE